MRNENDISIEYVKERLEDAMHHIKQLEEVVENEQCWSELDYLSVEIQNALYEIVGEED
jgi:hypothetical protein